MNEEELLKYMIFTDDKVMFDKCFYQEVMMPCFSNSITYKNIVKELEKENQQLKNQLQQKEDIIDKARKYVKENSIYFAIKDKIGNYFANCNCDELLEILDNKGGKVNEIK